LYRFVPGTEYTVKVLQLDAPRPSMDHNGDVWTLQGQGVARLRFAGLDASGTPKFGKPELFRTPAPFTSIGRARYDAARDAMYLSGFTKDRPSWNGADKVMGSVLARYDNWTRGGRTATWTTVLPYTAGGNLQSPTPLGLVSMDITGDGRIYTTTLTYKRPESQSRMYVYDESTGRLLTSWLPGPTFGDTGWVDLVDGVRARLLPNGETLVFQEDDYRAKIVMYRIGPKAGS